MGNEASSATTSSRTSWQSDFHVEKEREREKEKQKTGAKAEYYVCTKSDTVATVALKLGVNVKIPSAEPMECTEKRVHCGQRLVVPTPESTPLHRQIFFRGA